MGTRTLADDIAYIIGLATSPTGGLGISEGFEYTPAGGIARSIDGIVANIRSMEKQEQPGQRHTILMDVDFSNDPTTGIDDPNITDLLTRDSDPTVSWDFFKIVSSVSGGWRLQFKRLVTVSHDLRKQQ